MLLVGKEVIHSGSLFPAGLGQGSEIYTMPTCVSFWTGLLYAVTGNAYASHMLICGIVVPLLLAAAFVYAMSPLGVKPYFSLSAFALLLPMPQYFYYIGFTLIGVVAVGYCARIQAGDTGPARKILRWILPFAAFSTGVGSARLTVICWLPLACYSAWLFLRRTALARRSERKALFEPFFWLVLNISGLIYAYGKGNIVFSLFRNMTTFTAFSGLPGKIGENIRGLLVLLRIRIGDQSQSLTGSVILHDALMLLLYIIMIYMAVLSVFRERKIGKGISLFVFSLASLLSFAVITFTQAGGSVIDAARYLFPALSLAAVCFAMAAAFAQARKRKYAYWVMLLLLLAVSLMQARKILWTTAFDASDEGFFSQVSWAAAFQQVTKPEILRETRVLAEYMAGHGLSKGYASYWNSYRYTAASNEKLEIAAFLPTGPDMVPQFQSFPWVVSKRYFSPEFADSHVFVLLTNAEDDAAQNSPGARRFLSHARKLEPVLNYQVYVFEHANPFILPEFDLAHPGGSYDLLSWSSPMRGPFAWEDGSVLFAPGKDQVLFGPHTPLQRGIYRVCVRYLEGAAQGSGNRTPARFDVVDRLGTRTFAEAELDPDATAYESGTVNIPDGVNDANFRIFVPDDCPFRVDSFVVTRIK